MYAMVQPAQDYTQSVGLWLLPSPQRCESNVLKLTGLSPSSPRQLSYGYQNWESGDIINLNQSSGHHQNSRIPGW